MRTNTKKTIQEYRISAKRRFGDIPASVAMVAWNDAPDGREVSRVLENYYDGAIIVIPHPDNEHWCSALNMSNTDGACWCQWGQMTTRKQVDALMALAIEIGVDAGIGMKDIHAALSVIPEYRERLEKCSERKLFWDNSMVRFYSF